jgi:hypothetical protein
VTPSDLSTAEEVGIRPGDLFIYCPDRSQGPHPYMWRVSGHGSRTAEEVLRDDIIELEPGITLLVLEANLPDAGRRSGSAVAGLTALAAGGTYWLHLDPRGDRALTGSIRLVSRLWLEPSPSRVGPYTYLQGGEGCAGASAEAARELDDVQVQHSRQSQ